MVATPIKIEWCEAAAVALAGILGDQDEVKAEILEGISELWFFPGCGYVVTRIERETVTGEFWLVVVAGAGQNLAGVVSYWQQIADKHGLGVRIHSARRGMVKLLEPLGFEAVETIYKYKRG